MTYATTEEIDVANEISYDVSCDQKRGHRFVKYSRHVWAIQAGWQTADLVNGFFKNHRAYDDLESALRRPIYTSTHG